MFCRLKVRSYVLAANVAGTLKVAPLQILKFPVVLPHKFLDAEKFNLRFSDASEITEIADKLAALYGIPVEDILDDHTLFLHRGGGDFLRRYREAKGWNRQQLADHAKVSRTSIRCWESGQKTISQKCFCHLVENLGSDFPSMLRM